MKVMQSWLIMVKIFDTLQDSVTSIVFCEPNSS